MKLQDLNNYSMQEIFDKVAKHLLTQNKQSIAGIPNTNNSVCKYRHDGLMCAVGVLIDDADYSPKLEGQGVRELLERFEPITEPISREKVNMLSWLQNIHDSFCVDEWKEKLKAIAAYFNLNTDTINAH